jgi:hypothetical protein
MKDSGRRNALAAAEESVELPEEWAALRHVRIRLKYNRTLPANGGGPIRPQALRLTCRASGTHLTGNRSIVVRIGLIVVMRILPWCEHPT